jgi:hypothetical protein
MSPRGFESFSTVEAEAARKVDDGNVAGRPSSLNLSRLSVSFADENHERKVNTSDSGGGGGGGGGGGVGGRGAGGGGSGTASPRVSGASALSSQRLFSAPIFDLGEDLEEELAIDESDIISGGGGKRPEPERERPAGPIPR